MKAVEFAYWLQGYFEIKDASTHPINPFGMFEDELSRDQVTGLLEKAGTVQVGESAAEKKAGIFVEFVKTTLAKQPFRATATAIKEKLHELFIHDIDPSYEGDQSVLGKLHKSGPEPGMRC